MTHGRFFYNSDSLGVFASQPVYDDSQSSFQLNLMRPDYSSLDLPDIEVTARRHADGSGGGSGGGGGLFFISISGSGQSFLDQLFMGEALIWEDAPPPVSEEDDIIVEVTKQQVEAAKIAYSQAGQDL